MLSNIKDFNQMQRAVIQLKDVFSVALEVQCCDFESRHLIGDLTGDFYSYYCLLLAS